MKVEINANKQLNLNGTADKHHFLNVYETLVGLNASSPGKTTEILIEALEPGVKKIQGLQYGIYKQEIEKELKKLKKQQNVTRN